MIKPILLNQSPLSVSKSNLPFLIHGQDGKGASLFTVTLVAHLFKQNHKIIFLSGYPMARDELLDQIGTQD
ncbi:hypothetical protein ACFL2V_22310, partial [Pseudomonadota bacterium]